MAFDHTRSIPFGLKTSNEEATLADHYNRNGNLQLPERSRKTSGSAGSHYVRCVVGRAVTSDDERNETDHCPDCGQQLEIAAIKFSRFWQAALLFVCPGCGLAKADGPKPQPSMAISVFPCLGKLALVRRN